MWLYLSVRFTPRTILAAGVTAAALVAAACSSGTGGTTSSDPSTPPDSANATGAVFPGERWSTVDATDAGFDQAALDELAAEAESASSTCLVIVKDGELINEWYWQDAAPETKRQAWSVTKSLTSTLVGVARDDGDLDIDDPASEYLTEWQGTASEAVTIKDLLSNDSGREWNLSIDYVDLAVTAADKTAFALALGQDAPAGEIWAYNNSAIQTLSPIMERATGERLDDYAKARLFDEIGMADSEWGSDSAGNPLAFMGLETTCRDLARFGYPALHQGNQDGNQVVSADYMTEATGAPSTPLNSAYGYLWWLNREGTVASPAAATEARTEGSSPDDQMVPDVAQNVFWALGFQEQIVAVLPDEGIVAVRMGDGPPADTPFTNKQLTTGVLATFTG